MALRTNADLIGRLARIWARELEQRERLIVGLGQLSSDVRIARLILDLFSRLQDRGLVRDKVMDFPLRHHQVANLMGLSPTYVSYVLSEFRQKGLIEIVDRSLAILDLPGLQRTAEVG